MEGIILGELKLMRALLIPFFLLAALGLALSVVAHVLALLGQTPPGGSLVMGLHAGIFVVWIPTILISLRLTKGSNRKDFWKIAMSGCPEWVRYAFYALFAYAIFNFILFFTSSHAASHHGGEVTPELIRGFSGHWMVFYAAACATMYSAINNPNLFKERKCSGGHTVSMTDQFCPTCGRVLTKSSGA
jgi:hypothetical protein